MKITVRKGDTEIIYQEDVKANEYTKLTSTKDNHDRMMVSIEKITESVIKLAIIKD